MISAIVLLAGFLFFGDHLKNIDIVSGGVVKEVKFSVIRYEGKAVSVQLIINGSGKLENKHRISEDMIGVAYYKQSELVGQIQSCESHRYIPSGGGFTSDIVTKEIHVK